MTFATTELCFAVLVAAIKPSTAIKNQTFKNPYQELGYRITQVSARSRFHYARMQMLEYEMKLLPIYLNPLMFADWLEPAISTRLKAVVFKRPLVSLQAQSEKQVFSQA